MAMLLEGSIARDQHSYDRMFARQCAAAEHVLVTSEFREEPAATDLADIGVDARTAQADIALLRRVRAFADPQGHAAAPD